MFVDVDIDLSLDEVPHKVDLLGGAVRPLRAGLEVLRQLKPRRGLVPVTADERERKGSQQMRERERKGEGRGAFRNPRRLSGLHLVAYADCRG